MISMSQQGAIPANSQMQTLNTFDSMGGTRVELPARSDPTRDSLFRAADDSLSEFFKRPIPIAKATWTPGQGQPFSIILDPWSGFFGNTRVCNRINNYMAMRSKLCLRFLINGNGFYYGRLMADYAPLAANDECSSYNTLVPENAIQASQRQKVFLDPSSCCSQEMCLPFIWAWDAVSIPDAEWAQLGTLYIRELSGLKHANGSAQPITITILAWAEDVVFSIPTSADCAALLPQAGEEYSAPGPVENLASATAAAATALTKVPSIAPFARATAIAAGGAAKLAGAFGWSRPPIIRPLEGMRPTYISALAPGDAGDNTTKLTVDSKQELSVDPNIIGIDLPDELSIANIAARESYLTSFAWATSKVANDLLWNTRVNPSVSRQVSGFFYMPACCFATVPFDFWRGRMRYRFQIVASAHHKGRLKIVYDPYGMQSVESNVQYTRYVDLETQRDFIMEIDWAQPSHYQGSADPQIALSMFGTSAQASTYNKTSNGVLAIYVLNDLATPNSTVNNDISVNVFVSCEDLEVAGPKGFSYTTTYNATEQAGEDAASTAVSSEPGCGTSDPDSVVGAVMSDPNDFSVYFGERIVNFRQLLHRYVLHSSFVYKGATTATINVVNMVLPSVPLPYGYNSVNMHTTTAGGKFNYTYQTMLSYLMPAFVAMRGSHRLKVVVTGPGLMSVSACRTSPNSPAVPTAVTNPDITSNSTYARSLIGVNATALQSFLPGAAVTPAANQPVLEVEFPFQRPVRFTEPRVGNAAKNSEINPWFTKSSVRVVNGNTTGAFLIDRYVAVGEDFGLYYFQGAPPMDVLSKPA